MILDVFRSPAESCLQDDIEAPDSIGGFCASWLGKVGAKAWWQKNLS